MGRYHLAYGVEEKKHLTDGLEVGCDKSVYQTTMKVKAGDLLHIEGQVKVNNSGNQSTACGVYISISKTQVSHLSSQWITTNEIRGTPLRSSVCYRASQEAEITISISAKTWADPGNTLNVQAGHGYLLVQLYREGLVSYEPPQHTTTGQKWGSDWAKSGQPINLLYGIRSRTNSLDIIAHRQATGEGETLAGDAVEIGSGWGAFSQVFSGGEGVIYAVSGEELYYTRHFLNDSGDISFQHDPKRIAGPGWGVYTHLFSGGGGVIYGVNGASLYVTQHTDYLNGSSSFTQNMTRIIEGPWVSRLSHIFSGGFVNDDTRIYVVDSDGSLWWGLCNTQHGFKANLARIGCGFGTYARTLCAGGDGVLYGIDGDLLFVTRHPGYQDGSPGCTTTMHAIGGGGYSSFSKLFAARL